MRADAVQRPSIGVVAAQARVSVKTVSRVLNDSACVTPQTRERVMRVIQQLNYSPSANARRLSGHRSKLIGLPFDNLYASYVTEVQSGSMRICNAERYQLIMHACESSAATLADEIRRFVQCVRVDGVLLSPPLSDRLDVMEALKQEDIPFVRIAASRRIESSLSVITNDQQTARRMTQHLASLGHTRIAFVGSRAPDASSELRYEGFRQGLQMCGLGSNSDLVKDCAGGFEAGVQCGRELLSAAPSRRPTAIFACNDQIAAGVLRAAHELGVRVPQELSVAGFEDVPMANQVWPRLTTVRHPLAAMAERAAWLLMQRLRGEAKSTVEQFVPSSLVFRQSTGRLAPA